MTHSSPSRFRPPGRDRVTAKARGEAPKAYWFRPDKDEPGPDQRAAPPRHRTRPCPTAPVQPATHTIFSTSIPPAHFFQKNPVLARIIDAVALRRPAPLHWCPVSVSAQNIFPAKPIYRRPPAAWAAR